MIQEGVIQEGTVALPLPSTDMHREYLMMRRRHLIAELRSIEIDYLRLPAEKRLGKRRVTEDYR